MGVVTILREANLSGTNGSSSMTVAEHVQRHPPTSYTLSDHAKVRMVKWQITREMIEATLLRPEGRVHDEEGKYFYQRTFLWHSGKPHLLRVLVDETQTPLKIVTMYHTSRFRRYT
jgi:hypothetical protein